MHDYAGYEQPALGCVYKLVEIDNTPRIKLSQEVSYTSLWAAYTHVYVVNAIDTLLSIYALLLYSIIYSYASL